MSNFVPHWIIVLDEVPGMHSRMEDFLRRNYILFKSIRKTIAIVFFSDKCLKQKQGIAFFSKVGKELETSKRTYFVYKVSQKLSSLSASTMCYRS